MQSYLNDYDKGWFVGMIEGEGSFYLRITKSKYGSHYITPMFSLGQTRNRVSVERISTLLSSESIKNAIYRLKKDGHETVTVNTFSDCLKLAEILSQCAWHGKKGEVFKYWNEALKLMIQKKHLTENGFRQILEMRYNMWLNSEKRQVKKYKSEYFVDIPRLSQNSITWSEEEIAILKDNYPHMKVKDIVKLLPKRSLSAINGKASTLGINRRTNRNRLDLDTNKINTLYDDGLNCKEIAKIFNVSRTAINNRLLKEGKKFQTNIYNRIECWDIGLDIVNNNVDKLVLEQPVTISDFK
jgi:hypothetical protein